MPKISVIVATKNCFDKIDTIMLSLFRQEEQDFEIICVDDCSDDGTLNLLQHYAEFDKRIKIIAQPKPIGILPCCKVGLESATAPYALFLNGNHHVLLVQMFLRRLLNNALRNRSDVVYTPVIFIDALLFTAHQLYVIPKKTAEAMAQIPCVISKTLNPQILFLLYLSPYIKLYRTEFVKNMDFSAFDEPFFLNVLMKAERLSYDLDFLCYRQIWPQDFDRPQIFDEYAQMEEVLRQNGVYETHKHAFICRKMQSLWTAVAKALPQNQRQMFEQLKKEFANEDFSQYDAGLLKQHIHYNSYMNLSTMSYDDFLTIAADEKNE